MRIAVLTLLAALTTLPIVAGSVNAFATTDMASRLMSVVRDDLSESHEGTPADVAAMAAELNNIDVGQ